MVISTTSAGHSPSPIRPFGVWLLAMVILSLVGLTALPDEAAAQVTYTEEAGTLADGTRYAMRVPSNWNGTLIRDLDFVTRMMSNDARQIDMLIRGYAVAGTARHDRRWIGNYNPVREIAHLDTVLDLFEERFRKPDRVIQHGCSGGGHVTLAVAEHFSDRVDGAIAWGAHTPMWFWNTMLDGWFVLKALLAPDLKIIDLPREVASLRPRYTPLVFAWRQVINAAQKTSQGRARLALAVTIGQWPDWVNSTVPIADRDDVAALQQSMYRTLYEFSREPGGLSRFMFESAADHRLTQPSWNTDVDYSMFFDNGNEFNKRAVRQLYEEADLDLETDLNRINAFPRVSADAQALEFWRAPGRNVQGDPKIPVLRIHDIGDPYLPVSMVQGYSDQVRANGKDNLYRAVFTRAGTHCGFTVAESAAAIETLEHRLDTGSWGSTAPEQLNALAGSLDESSSSRFTSIDEYKVGQYNRTWTPD